MGVLRVRTKEVGVGATQANGKVQHCTHKSPQCLLGEGWEWRGTEDSRPLC